MSKPFTNEIISRVLSMDEREDKREISQRQVNAFRQNAEESFINVLGIAIGEDGEIPSAGYIPRMFLTYMDEEGNEKITSFKATGMQPFSQEFTASKGRTYNVNTAKAYGNALKALVVPEKKAEGLAAAPAQPVKEKIEEIEEPVVQPVAQI